MGAAKVTNESSGPYTKQRIRAAVGVAYGTDVDQVRRVLIDVAQAEPLVVEDPEPRVRFRRFGDSSLDCPEPGISYLQALTSGYRIAAEADGRRFDIRVAGGHAKICHRQKPGKKPSQLPAGSQASALIDLARHDLIEPPFLIQRLKLI